MLLLRIVGLLAALAIGASVVMYIVTGDRRYRRFAWQLFKITLFFVALVLVLLFFERVWEAM
jgi:hypothetical protein